MSSSDPSRKLRVDAELIKSFAAGELSPVVEDKIAAYLDQRPKLVEQGAALSGENFLAKLRDVRQRSLPPVNSAPSSLGSGTRQEFRQPGTASDSKKLPNVTGVPKELANYPAYKIIKELGRGGMGVVYLAKNIQMDRLEVLKVLNERLLDHAGAKERFLREVRAVSKLNHANIVTSYSILPLQSQLVFVMEFVNGTDLHHYIQARHPLPVGQACSFAQQIAAGLQHAYERGLVHRDIKPANVIVYRSDGRMQLKILDFGLAKASSEKTTGGLTQDGTMLGTPEYMSPEQTLNAAKADIRADIYSLGCTLHCMLTGNPPFRGTHGEVLMAHAQRDPQSVNLVRPDVSPELAAVIGKMMAKTADKRYQTPSDVIAALKPFIDESSLAERRGGESQPASGTVNDLAASDRETSVEAAVPSFALDTASQLDDSKNQLAAIANLMGDQRRGVSQIVRRQQRRRAKPKKRRPSWFVPVSIAGVLLFFFGGLWAGGVFRLKTSEGTIVVEQVPQDADILVDGKRIEITWNQGKDHAEIQIAPGEHKVDVLVNGTRVTGESVTVNAGERSSLVAKYEEMPPQSDKSDAKKEAYSEALAWRNNFAGQWRGLYGTKGSEKSAYVPTLDLRVDNSDVESMNAIANGPWKGQVKFNPSSPLSAVGDGHWNVNDNPNDPWGGQPFKLTLRRIGPLLHLNMEVDFGKAGPSFVDVLYINKSVPDDVVASEVLPEGFAAGAEYHGKKTHLDSVFKPGRSFSFLLHVNAVSHGAFSGYLHRGTEKGTVPIVGYVDGSKVNWREDGDDESWYEGKFEGGRISGEFNGDYYSQRAFGKFDLNYATSESSTFDQAKPNTLAPSTSSLPDVEADSNFVPLWNGKDFDGWSFAPRPSGAWTIENDYILGSGLPGPMKTARDDYQHFDLRLEVAMCDSAHGSIQFGGSEKQLITCFLTLEEIGKIHLKNIGKANASPRPPQVQVTINDSEWFQLRILQTASRLTIYVNGRPVNDRALQSLDKPNAIHFPKFNDEQGQVKFRNLRISEIRSKASTKEEQANEVLFNGRDLTGWKGSPSHWSVTDGCLTGITTSGNPLAANTCLAWQGGEFEDFELEFEYKISGGGNSGLQYRSQLINPAQFIMSGYQADIDGSLKYSGSVYEEKGRGMLAERGQRVTIDSSGAKKVEDLGDSAQLASVLKPDDWNQCRVVAIGNRLSHYYNSQLMSEVVDDEATKSSQKGLIGFQLHRGEPMQVQLRNVRLKRLPAASISETTNDVSQTLSAEPIVPASIDSSQVSRLAMVQGRGDWIVENGELVQRNVNPPGSIISFGDPSWSRYELSLLAMSTQGPHGFKIIFHKQETTTHVEYALGNYHNDVHSVEFPHREKSYADHRQLKKLNDSTKIRFQEWYSVRLRVDGSQFYCYLNGELLFEGNNEDFDHGMIGLGTWGTSARFKDLQVKELGSARLLWSGFPTIE